MHSLSAGGMEYQTADPAWRHGVAFTQGDLLPQQFALAPAPRDAKFIWAKRSKRSPAAKDGSETVVLPAWAGGKAVVVSSERLYAAPGKGWRERLLTYWRNEWKEARAEGYTQLFAVGEVDLPLPVPFPEVVHYEREVDVFLHQVPFSALCVYDLFQVNRGQALDLIYAHDYFSIEVLPGKVFGPVSRRQLPLSGQLADLVDFGLELARLGRTKKALAVEQARLAALSDALAAILGRLTDQLTVVAGFAELDYQVEAAARREQPPVHPLLSAAREAAATVKDLGHWQQQLMLAIARPDP
ncbi:MEDS domain-containing protein [Gelria sp. Kuro-4]|uniref:MEDS domain-containing protein n=1 Tax=Gelria sp. Kuro-4 TaxID=2796927 RepID=UPI001C80CE51|nr:MEDS domain-containing protein [Gelria sp. Kuro-4]